jgi:hypothetical protein
VEEGLPGDDLKAFILVIYDVRDTKQATDLQWRADLMSRGELSAVSSALGKVHLSPYHARGPLVITTPENYDMADGVIDLAPWARARYEVIVMEAYEDAVKVWAHQEEKELLNRRTGCLCVTMLYPDNTLSPFSMHRGKLLSLRWRQRRLSRSCVRRSMNNLTYGSKKCGVDRGGSIRT